MPPVGLALPEERAGSIFGNGNGIHKPAALKVAVMEVPENGKEHVVTFLDVLVKAARVVSVEQVCAHIAWSKPEYSDGSPKRPDLPALKCIRFEVDWAEVPGPQQSLKQSDWQPLPSGDVDVCEVKVAGLRPGRTYAVRVRPVLDLEEVGDQWELRPQPSAPLLFSTAPTVPSQVKPPLLVARDRKSLKVKWNTPDEEGGSAQVLSYQLFLSPPPQEWPGAPDAQGYVEVYRGDERAFKVQKLVPGARYSFWVLAWNSVGCSEVGQVAAYSTQATVPSQPEPPHAVGATQTSITLSWTAPACNGSPITAFQLERDEGGTRADQSVAPGAGTNFMLAYAGTATTTTIGGLRSGAYYRFRVRANNGEGSSYWSECCVATTAASPPGPPTGIVVTATTRDSATLMWECPTETGGAPVHAHEVELQAVSRAAVECMGPDWYAIFRGTERGCSINSLRAGCTYRVRIRSANPAGWGSWAMPVECITAADVPEAPGPPSIATPGTSVLGLQWHPPLHNGGAKISGYRLELAVLPGSVYEPQGPATGVLSEGAIPGVPGGSPTFTVYRGEEAAARVEGLMPGGVYAYRVAAANAQGVGPWSEWGLLGTAADTPLPPPPPSLVAPPSASGLALAWGAPEGRGAAVTGYVVQVAAGGFVTSSGQVVGGPVAPGPSSSGGTGGTEGGEGAGSDGATSTQLRWQQVYRGPASAFELQHLAPSSRYLVRVAAMNAVGTGGWGEAAVFTTAPAPPTPPASVVAQAAGAHDLLVRWTPPASDNGAAVSGYAVDCAPAPSAAATARGSAAGAAAQGAPAALPAWAQVVSTGPGESSAHVSHLAPGRSYVVRVRALNAAGSSGPTHAPAAVATLPAPPGAPGRLALLQRTANAARLKWDSPADENGAPVTEYRLEVALQQGGPIGRGAAATAVVPGASGSDQAAGVWVLVYSGSDTEARVSDLAPAATYLARVSAANDAGHGPCSAPLSFTTAPAPPGPPSGLRAWVVGLEVVEAPAAPAGAASADGGDAGEPGTPNSTTPAAASASAPAAAAPVVRLAPGAWPLVVGISWSAPAPLPGAAAAATYEVHAAPVPAAPKHELRVNVGKGTDATLDRLQPGTRYELRVRAVGAEGAGHGAWSDKVELTLPAPPAGVSVAAVSGTDGAGGAVTGGEAGAVAEGGGAKRRKGGSGSKKGGATAALRAAGAGGASSSGAADSDDGVLVSGAASSRAGAPGGAGAAAPVGRKVNPSKLAVASAQKKPPPPPDTWAGKLYLLHKTRRALWRTYRWKLGVFVAAALVWLLLAYLWARAKSGIIGRRDFRNQL